MSATGIVTKINKSKGYGRVRSDKTGASYLFAIKDVKFGEPSVGDKLTFEPSVRDGRRVAEDPWNIEGMEVRA